LDNVKRSGTSGAVTIVGEMVKPDFVQTKFLATPNVVESSIQVTDASGKQPFSLGFDYDIQVVGNLTGLRLVPGSGITPGDTVLVNYRSEQTTDISFLSDAQDFTIRYEFERYLTGLALYYQWHNLTPRGVSGSDSSVLAFTRELVGAQYAWRPRIGPEGERSIAARLFEELQMTQEFETYRSGFSNYDESSTRLEAYRYFPNRIKWAWNGGMLLINYKDVGFQTSDGNSNNSRILFVGTSLGGPIRDQGYWEVEARLNRETGRNQETFGGLLGKIGWHFRKVRVEGGARFEQRDRFNSSIDRYHIYLQVAREF
jgi:hypothetical protein